MIENWIRNYYDSKNYLRKFSYSNEKYKDVIHDVWLKHFEKTGENLFEKKRSHVLVEMKRGFFADNIRENRYAWRGEFHWRSFLDITDPINDIGKASKIEEQIDTSIKINNIESKLSDNLKPTYKAIIEGREADQIAIETGTSIRTIQRQIKKIKEIAVSKTNWTNPFNGSKLEVKKSISQSEWEKRKDKDDFELYDYNEYYNLYEHKESKEGLLVKLPEEKTNRYIK